MWGPLHLLVGIDTEGDNQWDAAAREHQTFENIYALGALHDRFERHGVRPTYLVTYPVVCDPRSADALTRLVASGTCEIGTHHHAWETPPCTPEDVQRHLYRQQTRGMGLRMIGVPPTAEEVLRLFAFMVVIIILFDSIAKRNVLVCYFHYSFCHVLSQC
jgi:hypothetical protein